MHNLTLVTRLSSLPGDMESRQVGLRGDLINFAIFHPGTRRAFLQPIHELRDTWFRPLYQAFYGRAVFVPYVTLQATVTPRFIIGGKSESDAGDIALHQNMIS